MSEAIPASHVDQLTDLLWRLLRVKHRLLAFVPEDLAHLKARLRAGVFEGTPRPPPDYGLVYRVGMALARQSEPLTMGELSQASGVPPSTATRMVDWLVANGYVERLPDPEDRRVVRVRLTEFGRELYRAVSEFIRGRLEPVLRELTDDEREALIALLRKLLDSLDKAES